tara:strand:+ start:571 stop:1641 length:1071 start_codon:yes stop_codon:yes gene_type:complete
MSVYKPFTTSDVVVTPFKVNKNFSFYGKRWTDDNVNVNIENAFLIISNDTIVGNNINRYFGTVSSSSLFTPGSNLTGIDKSLNSNLVYDSVKQLYYTNFIRNKNGSPVLTSSIGIDNVRRGQVGIQPSYDNFLPNTLLANRLFPTGSNDRIGVISISTELFGEYIKPGTFNFSYKDNLVHGDTSTPLVKKQIKDDGNGNLLLYGNKVGDLIYQHGMAILTAFGTSITGSQYGVNNNLGYGIAHYGSPEKEQLDVIITSQNAKIDFESTMTIYESQYKCTFSPSEFSYSQNPSTIIGNCTNSEGKLYDFVTGSYFEPYITTVGLYSNANELIAVGKLSQPLQSSNFTDTTILVNLDL